MWVTVRISRPRERNGVEHCLAQSIGIDGNAEMIPQESGDLCARNRELVHLEEMLQLKHDHG